jgi:hypothetical protein
MSADCILWQGSKTQQGYGWRYYKGKRWLAHRAGWHTIAGTPNQAAGRRRGARGRLLANS